MEGLTVTTDMPRRRPSKNTSLTPSSAWSAVSKPFQSKPKLSAGVMSSWVEKQNEEAFAQHKRIFYVPGLTSMARSSEASYAKLPSSGKWDFKGIPVLTVNTDMPPTGSELDLRTELDFWETVVPDKSRRPTEAETPALLEQPEILFDANDQPNEEEKEGEQEKSSEDGLTRTNEPGTISLRPLSATGANGSAGTDCSVPERLMVFQPQTAPNLHLSRTQSGRILLSRAWCCCGLRPGKPSQVLEKL